MDLLFTDYDPKKVKYQTRMKANRTSSALKDLHLCSFISDIYTDLPQSTALSGRSKRPAFSCCSSVTLTNLVNGQLNEKQHTGKLISVILPSS